jgi:type VI secretion system secreted protein Hcp
VGRVRLRWTGPLIAVAIVAGATTAIAQLSDDFTNPPAPIPGHGQVTYLTMIGAHTGAFTGGVVQRTHEGAIAVLALDGGLTVPTDQATGQPAGRATCNGVEFRKPTDRATPLLFDAAANNENITSATFNEYAANSQGAAVLTLQLRLTNAHLTSVHHVNGTTSGAYDDVTLVPSTVRVTWKPTGTVSQYDCRAPAP